MNATPSQNPLLACALLVLGSACIHSFEKKEGPTDEQLLDLYTTTATYLYEDDSLLRAQDQAVKVLEIDPEHRPMRRMIGWIRLRLGAPEDLIIAEQFFRNLREEGDQNEATTLGLATTLERLGTAYDESSRELVAEGQELTPEIENQARELAATARDYWHESQELYSETVETGEGNTSGMNGLQRVHALQGDYEQSLAWSERLLERSSEEMAVWRRLLTQEDLTEAEERLFRENERISRELRTDTLIFVASMLHNLGRDAEAIAHLDQVVELQPELAQVYSRRGQLLGSVGEYERAIADLDQYLRLSEEPFEHPEVRQAFALRVQYEKGLAAADI